MGRNHANQRKQNYVDRAVQGALLLRLVSHWALFLVGAGAFVVFVELVAGGPREGGRNLMQRHGPTIFAVLALMPIYLHDLCKLSNRFVGPIVRLRRAMRALAEGREVPPIQFRDHDFWKELAEDFNRIAERVQTAEAAANDIPREATASVGAACELHPVEGG